MSGGLLPSTVEVLRKVSMEPPEALFKAGTENMAPVWSLVHALECLGPFRYANEMQDEVARAALLMGWRVHFEWPAPYEHAGRRKRGRIDLLLLREDNVLAVELDDLAPRAKSVAKLLGIRDATARLIVLRTAQTPHWHHGILVSGVRGRASNDRTQIRASR